jgi:acyl-CoA thioester hydrolase
MIVHSHRVQFYETDLMGIMHHSNYIRIFEEARVAWAHNRGILDYQKKESASHIAVLETHVRHLKPAYFGDDLKVEVQAKLEGVRMTFEYKMYSPNSDCISKATTVHVPMSLELKPIKIPKTFKEVFSREPWIETWL